MRRADALELPFLQHAQELGLHVGREVADLVEKERAAVGQLEAPLAHRHRTREGAAYVTEELGLDQRGRERRAVHADERAAAAGAAIVDRPREELLARAGLAEEHDRRVGRCHFLNARDGETERRAVADDVLEFVVPVLAEPASPR